MTHLLLPLSRREEAERMAGGYVSPQTFTYIEQHPAYGSAAVQSRCVQQRVAVRISHIEPET